jgi:hypothetical protein
MIQIIQYNQKWRFLIEGERWEFDNLEQMKENLNIILEMKNSHGNLKERN